jgi:hypothetical protein
VALNGTFASARPFLLRARLLFRLIGARDALVGRDRRGSMIDDETAARVAVDRKINRAREVGIGLAVPPGKDDVYGNGGDQTGNDRHACPNDKLLCSGRQSPVHDKPRAVRVPSEHLVFQPKRPALLVALMADYFSCKSLLN